MRQKPDHYATLHVNRDAPIEIIRASYRTLMQQLRLHPDLGGDVGHAQRINAAYAVLRDPERRRAYDAELDGPGSRPSPRRSARHAGESDEIIRTGTWATGTWAYEALAIDPSTVYEHCPFCERHHVQDVDQIEPYCRRCRSPLTIARHRGSGDGTRRALRRIKRTSPLTFKTHWAQADSYRGTLRDLSLSGMKLTAGIALVPGQQIQIECDACRAVARVVWCSLGEGVAPADWQIGVEFVALAFRRKKGSLLSVPA